MDLIRKKVKDITMDLPVNEAAAKIFRYVRDIPYYLVPFGEALNISLKKVRQKK